MTANPLVAERIDTRSPLAGTLLLEDGEQLVTAMQDGDWISGGMAAFSGAMDTVAAVSDPLGTLFAMGFGWVIDHVNPLNTWLEDLTGDAAQVTAFAGTWANVSTHLEQSADELTRVVAADLEAMDGATIAAYRTLAADMAEHMGGASRWAGAMSTALEVASTLVQIVHDIVRDAIAQVLGAVASYAAELVFTAGLATPLVIEQAATRAAALATRIGRHLTHLLTSFRDLDGLLRGLRRLLDELGEQFGRLFRGADAPDAPTPKSTTPGGGSAPHVAGSDAGGGPAVTPHGADPVTPHAHDGADPAAPDAASDAASDAATPSNPAPSNPAQPLPDGATHLADEAPDADYGQPRPDAGTTLQPWAEPPTTANPDVAALGGDAAHPWGTNPDTGRPFTRAEFQERFVTDDGGVRWPPNGGAVPGSRLEFTSADDFRSAYGSGLDRIGDPRGEYLGFPPGAAYADRSLYPTSLGKVFNEYEFSGDLPAGWTIETSEIAPAFGQPGGGMQVLIRDELGAKMRVTDLVDAGVLAPVPRTGS